MTPTIALAGYPPWDHDPNDVGLRALGGLKLVQFEFFPHYRDSPRMRRALLAYPRNSPNPIYAWGDGGGIAVDGDRFVTHGDVLLFDRKQLRRIRA